MSALLCKRNALLRAGLSLVAAMAIAVLPACGPEPAREPTPVPTVAPTVAPPVPTPRPPETPTPVPSPEGPDRPAAPNFSLPAAAGGEVALAGLLEEHKAVVLVFYRGYF